MALYAQEMERALTGRAGDWLARKAWPHVTMVVAFAASAWAAYECSIRIAGWGGLALRLSVNFLAGYAVFLLCLGIWIWTKPTLDRSALLEDAPDAIETKDPWDDEAIELREQVFEHVNRGAHDAARREGAQGMVGLALVVMIFGAVFVALHMIWYARWHLGHMLVLGGKVRHRALAAPPALACFVTPLRLTAGAATILLVHYALLGLLLQLAFPKATTLLEAVRLAVS